MNNKRYHVLMVTMALTAALGMASAGAFAGETQNPETVGTADSAVSADNPETGGTADSAVSADNLETGGTANSAVSADNPESKGAGVASADDKAPAEELDDSDRIPLTVEDLNEGTYEIEVESSSSMFKITSCTLTVEDGEMTAAMTMGGTGYLRLYMGTGEEALEADEEDYISYEEDEEGAHVFTVPVEELNKITDCAAFSKKKEMWYDRTLIFDGNVLPEEAFAEEEKYQEVQASIPKKSTKKVLTVGRKEENEGDSAGIRVLDDGTLADGTYQVEVTLTGGSGKSTVASPCELKVKEGKMTATIEWSSPYYDYMVVDGEKYEPVNTDGNSVFEIPVAALGEELPVVADTTAMSEPHEVEYTLIFQAEAG